MSLKTTFKSFLQADSANASFKAAKAALVKLVKPMKQAAREKVWKDELEAVARAHYKAQPNANDMLGKAGHKTARHIINTSMCKGRFMRLGVQVVVTKKAVFAFEKHADSGKVAVAYSSLLTMFKTYAEKHHVKPDDAMNIACAIAQDYNTK